MDIYFIGCVWSAYIPFPIFELRRHQRTHTCHSQNSNKNETIGGQTNKHSQHNNAPCKLFLPNQTIINADININIILYRTFSQIISNQIGWNVCSMWHIAAVAFAVCHERIVHTRNELTNIICARGAIFTDQSRRRWLPNVPRFSVLTEHYSIFCWLTGSGAAKAAMTTAICMSFARKDINLNCPAGYSKYIYYYIYSKNKSKQNQPKRKASVCTNWIMFFVFCFFFVFALCESAHIAGDEQLIFHRALLLCVHTMHMYLYKRAKRFLFFSFHFVNVSCFVVCLNSILCPQKVPVMWLANGNTVIWNRNWECHRKRRKKKNYVYISINRNKDAEFDGISWIADVTQFEKCMRFCVCWIN